MDATLGAELLSKRGSAERAEQVDAGGARSEDCPAIRAAEDLENG